MDRYKLKSSFKSVEELKSYKDRFTKYLTSVRHAANCERMIAAGKMTEHDNAYCIKLRDRLKHVETCKEIQCSTGEICLSTKKVIYHWNTCIPPKYCYFCIDLREEPSDENVATAA